MIYFLLCCVSFLAGYIARALRGVDIYAKGYQDKRGFHYAKDKPNSAVVSEVLRKQMKTPISESVGIDITRNYGNQKSRVMVGQDLTPLFKGRDVKDVLAAELERLRGILDEQENALKKKEGKL